MLHDRRKVIKTMLLGIAANFTNLQAKSASLLVGETVSKNMQDSNGQNQLSRTLMQQLHAVEPSDEGRVKYYPCMVKTRDGSQFERVCFVEETFFNDVWGLRLEKGNSVHVSEIVKICESPYRLPAQFASRLYELGETGMGYHRFWITLNSGKVLLCTMGNILEFPDLSSDDFADGIANIKLYDDKEAMMPQDAAVLEVMPASFKWCVYQPL